jgi:hypothetical protein
MSLLEWFRDIAARSSGKDAADPTPQKVSGNTPSRRPRRPAEAYAGEWVRVLEEASPERNPFNTYTWELDTDSGTPRPSAGPQPAKAPGANPDDTYTWELQEGPPPEGPPPEADPWGLAESQKTRTGAGVNPYDTGVFQRTGWGDRSKAR